jgi:Na+/H+-dicarboxylate symporter
LEQQLVVARAEADRLASGWNPLLRFTGQVITLCGQVYFRLLMMVVLPLLITSIVCGSATLGQAHRFGRLAAATLGYYLSTTALAVVLGLTLVSWVEPGRSTGQIAALLSRMDPPPVEARPGITEVLLEVIRGRADRPGSGLVPGNIFAALAEMNVLGIIFFSAFAGLTLGAMGPGAAEVLHLLERINDLLMKMIRTVISLAPVGIFGLITAQMIEQGGARGFAVELGKLGAFTATVLVGLLVHFAILVVLVVLLGGWGPGRFLLAAAPALATAFGTSSSSATLPVSMECADEMGHSRPLSSFVLPLGATINMDGTALYEAVAAVFLAQVAGVQLGLGELVIVFLTATFAAIGAPGIPNAGLVTLVLVLTAVGIPPQGLGMLLAIDWFLDRCRTVVNVFGDLVGLTVLQRFFGKS